MGWKKLKEKYLIEHIVQRRDDRLVIGSAYVSDILSINTNTGIITNSTQSFRDFGDKYYPDLMKATPEEILAVLKEVDDFSESKTVYLIHNDEVIERQCEAVGYPNVTHDGLLMYENTTFLSKKEALKYLIKSIEDEVPVLKRVEDERYKSYLEMKKIREDRVVLLEKLKEEQDYET